VRLFSTFAALFALLTALTSCASPATSLYTIAVQPGPTISGGPKTVEIRAVGLAGYLDRSEIVRSSDGYRVDIVANDTWAEPLGQMIGRVLSLELTQRLPNSDVFPERGAISMTADATVSVNIERMDLDRDGNLKLIAAAEIEFKRAHEPVLKTFQITQHAASTATPDIVAAISAAIGQLADGLAQILRR
jgi:hypothetical protein